MDGLIKCILLTDSAEVIFIINNLSSISVNKTSKMCLQKKKISIKKGNRIYKCTSMQYFNKKNNIIQNVFKYKTKHPDRNFWILKRVTGNFTLW